MLDEHRRILQAVAQRLIIHQYARARGMAGGVAVFQYRSIRSAARRASFAAKSVR